MPYLEVRLGPDVLFLRFVGRIDYVFGRLPKADVQLRDMSVSRLHTQIFMDSRGNAFVRDLGSSGGTFHNDAQVKMMRLQDGARVRIGTARVTYHDAEPPVNAKDAPAQSEPKGLIRANTRQRALSAGKTVLAAERVSAGDDNQPAEAPPEVDAATFSDDTKPASSSGPKPTSKPLGKSTTIQSPPPPSPAKKKRATGIVQAPWDESWPPAAPPSEKRKPAGSIPLKGAKVSTPEDKSAASKSSPLAPPTTRKPGAKAAPTASGPQAMPAVPLGAPPEPGERKNEPTRKRTLAEEMMEDYNGPAAMPTVKLGDAPAKTPPGKPAAKRPTSAAAKPPAPVQPDPPAEPDLTTDEIAEYFGGERKSGKLEEVNFGKGDGEAKGADEDESVNFGPGAQLGGDEEMTEESELELGTSMAKTPEPPPRPATRPPTPRSKPLPDPDDVTVVAPKNAGQDDAKTVYVPKPPGLMADRVKPMAEGPGGDTFHVPKDMAAELAKAEEARLRARQAAAKPAAENPDLYEAAESLPDEKKARPASPDIGDTLTD